MGDYIKQLGFADEHEMTRLIADVDISTPQKLHAFVLWRDTDGTKAGLEKLLERETAS